MKRILSLLLAMFVVISLTACNLTNKSGINKTKSWDQLISEGIIYVTDGTVQCNQKSVLVGDLVIPDDGSVTAIGNRAFSYGGLTSITIPDSVTTIGYAAFSNCTRLTNVTIPDSVTTISYETFNYCSSLTSIEIPASVTIIGDEAFSSCSGLTNVIFKGTVEQWNAMQFGRSWNYSVPATNVECADGKVSIS